MARHYLYELRTRRGKPRYVGQTYLLGRRTREHKKKWPQLKLVMLLVGTRDYVCEMEKQLIAKYTKQGRDLLNVQPGGQWCPQHDKTPLTRKRIGDAHRGKKHSRATIEKLRRAQIAKWRDPEFRAKLEKANRNWTPERRARASAAQKRRMQEQGHPNIGKRWHNKPRTKSHALHLAEAAKRRWQRPEHWAKVATTLKRKGFNLRSTRWGSVVEGGDSLQ